MDKKLFEKLAKEICEHFALSCHGCPFWEPMNNMDVKSCYKLWREQQENAELALATWIGGTEYVRSLAEKETTKSLETRKEILQAAERCVCGGREMDHGTPEQSFYAIARQWEAYLVSKGLLKEGVTLHAWDAATMLALFKIARIAVGNFVADSYVDGCGYLACAGELAANEQGEKHEK